MDERHEIEITFPDKTPDVANRLAEDLKKDIRRLVKEDGEPARVDITRTDKTAQDFGTTLVLVLGTPAVTYLARAVLEWAKRTNNPTFVLNGDRFERIESHNVAAVVAAVLKTPRRRPSHGTK